MKVVVLLIAVCYSCTLFAEEIFSVYFVRHAEKDISNLDNRDPDLRPCGFDRAERLVDIFEKVQLQAIYSTDYTRTRSTARPTASSQKLAVQIYAPDELDILLNQLMAKKQDALVVGHSNTTSALAGKLAGIKLTAIDEKEYDRMYQVVVAAGSTKLQLLHQAFRCAD